MPTVHVVRRAHFNAAHRLHNPAHTDEWNRATFGKCNHPNWHGHNYVLEVTVAGEPDPETGYVVDLAVLKDVIEARVVNDLDHRNLNLDVDWLRGTLPSTENLAIAVWQRLVDHIPGAGRLAEIRLQETENNSAVYRGE
jgi:6-pyruvoyltetrahydropterin/6-carboxytetrahydropterin synthase